MPFYMIYLWNKAADIPMYLAFNNQIANVKMSFPHY